MLFKNLRITDKFTQLNSKPSDFAKYGIDNSPKRLENVANNAGEYFIDYFLLYRHNVLLSYRKCKELS